MSLEAVAQHGASPVGGMHLALECLVFQLGGEEYGINIQSVQELRSYETVTVLANAPAYVKGVINMRGVIVPVLDMRIRFGMPSPVYNESTVVVIINTQGRTLGLVVDGVSDAVTLPASDIKSVPHMSALGKLDYLAGLGVTAERMLILVDIDKLMASVDLPETGRLAA